MKQKADNKDLHASFFIIVTVLIILILAALVYIIFNNLQSKSYYENQTGNGVLANAAVIPIKGNLVINLASATKCDEITSDEIVFLIEKSAQDPNIKAIILDINSWGGSVVAASEIGESLLLANKTTVAWIREQGLSAAYYIASYADHIVADKYADVGSIGIIIEYEIQDITHETIKSVKYKDILSYYRFLTEDERDIVQKEVNQLHEFFVKDVAENRGMILEKVRGISDGLSYNGIKAKELGLIDEVGNKEEVLNYIRAKGIEPVPAYYNFETGSFDMSEPYFSLREGC